MRVDEVDNPTPPRRVALDLSIQLLFGGSQAQFGWLGFGVGLCICLAFLIHLDVQSPLFLVQKARTVTGHVTNQENLGFHEGEYGDPLMAYTFTFTAEDGRIYTGRSYKTGDSPFHTGDVTPVEYLPAHPEIARIPGMRCQQSGFETVLMLILPFIFGCMVWGKVTSGRQLIRLLAYGQQAIGRLTNPPITSPLKQLGTLTRPLAYEFSVPSGHRFTIYTGPTSVVHPPETAVILYHPAHPEQALVYLDKQSEFMINHNIVSARQPGGYALMVLPFFAVFGSLLWFMLLVSGMTLN